MNAAAGDKLVFLPERHTDFVLTVSVEAWAAIAAVAALAAVGVGVWLVRRKRRR